MSNPNLFILLPFYYNLCIGIFAICLSVFVLFSNVKNHASKLFFLLSFISGLSSLFSALMDLAGFHFDKIVYVFQTIYASLGGVVPSLSVLFMLSFPTLNITNLKRYGILLFLPAVFFAYVGFTEQFFSEIVLINGQNFVTRTRYYLYYSLYGSLSFITFMIIGAYKYRVETSPIFKQQLKILLLGSFFSGSLISAGLLIKYFGVDNFGYETGHLIFLTTTAFAVVKYRAFDIRTVAHYTFFGIVILLLFFLPLVIIPSVLNTVWNQDYFLLNQISWGLASIGYFIFFSKIVYPKLNALTFRSYIQRDQSIQRVVNMLKLTDDIGDIQGVVSPFLSKTIFTIDTCLVMVNKSGFFKGVFEQSSEEITLDKQTLKKLSLNARTINKKMLNDLHLDLLKEMNVHLVSTLVYKDEPVGFLLLKEKKNLKPYTENEIAFLEKVAETIAFQIDKFYNVKKAHEVANEIIHEVKNTSIGLEATVSALLAKEKLTSDDKESLNDVLNEMVSLQTFSKKHLYLEMVSKVENIQFHPVKISTLIDEAIKIHYSKLMDKNIKVKSTFDQQDNVYGDPVLIKILLINVLDNAIKYLDKPKDIEIYSKKDEGTQHIVIKDYGPGFQNTQQKHLSDWSSAGEYKTSSGIGLSLCQKIMKKHQGEIRIDSQAQKGTTVSLIFNNKEVSYA